MARAAYYGGADFFYRVNDDTELMNKWALTFVTAIDSLPLPGGEVQYITIHSFNVISLKFIMK